MVSKRFIVAVFMLLFALMVLVRILTNPRIKTIQRPDVVQLAAFGLLAGVGISLLLEKYLPA